MTSTTSTVQPQVRYGMGPNFGLQRTRNGGAALAVGR